MQILTKTYTHRLIWIKHSLDEKIKEEYARYEEVLGDLYDIHEKRNEKEEKEDTRECTIFIQKTTKSKKVNRGLYDIQKITKSKEKISRGLYDTKQRKKKSLGIVRYEKKVGREVVQLVLCMVRVSKVSSLTLDSRDVCRDVVDY